MIMRTYDNDINERKALTRGRPTYLYGGIPPCARGEPFSPTPSLPSKGDDDAAVVVIIFSKIHQDIDHLVGIVGHIKMAGRELVPRVRFQTRDLDSGIRHPAPVTQRVLQR